MENRIIIGDNLKVLKENLNILKSKIKLVYLDPPYNTKTKKTYNDNENSNIWLNKQEKLLHLVFQLMREDAVLFISIDDNEYASLKLLCDSIFNKKNYLGSFIINQSKRSNSKFINITHEYILCYCKDKSKIKSFSVKRINIPEEKKMIDNISKKVKSEKDLKKLIDFYCKKNHISWLKNYNSIDENGEIFYASDLSVPSNPREVNIPEINLKLPALKTRGWVSDKKFIELYKKNLLVFKKNRPYKKNFLKDAIDNVPSVLNFYSRQGTNDLKKIGLERIFDTPKPVELIKFLIRIVNLESNDIVLDAFAGSGTTAQAVFEVNKEDNKKINYFLIQKEEKINNKSTSFFKCLQHGIKPYISEILKLRIRRINGKK